MPVEQPLDLAAVEEPDPHALLEFLRAMEFNSLTKRISEAFGVEPPAPGEGHPPAPSVEARAPAEAGESKSAAPHGRPPKPRA